MARNDKHLYPSVHRGIVIAAVQALGIANHPAARRFSAGDLETLTNEAAEPDVHGDRQQGRGRHYYCAVTPKGEPRGRVALTGGYRNGTGGHAPSPLTMLEGEYRTALMLHRAGRFYPAMQSLSRAMHMLADICCPPHSSGLTYFSRYGRKHKRYEAEAAEIFWGSRQRHPDEHAAAQPWAADAAPMIPFEDYTDLWHIGKPKSPSRFTEICNALAESGADELEAVLGSDRTARASSIRRRLLLSIANCAALLAAFDRDLSDESLPMWQIWQPYWLCVPAFRLLVSEEPLYLQFEDDGTLTLATEEEKYLSVNKWGYVALREDTEGFVTHFRIGFEPLLTLYPDGDQNKPLSWSFGMLLARSRTLYARESDQIRACAFVLRPRKPEGCRVLFAADDEKDK